MQPVVYPLLRREIAVRLSELVFMVREYQILSSTVYLNVTSKDFTTNITIMTASCDILLSLWQNGRCHESE